MPKCHLLFCAFCRQASSSVGFDSAAHFLHAIVWLKLSDGFRMIAHADNIFLSCRWPMNAIAQDRALVDEKQRWLHLLDLLGLLTGNSTLETSVMAVGCKVK